MSDLASEFYTELVEFENEVHVRKNECQQITASLIKSVGDGKL